MIRPFAVSAIALVAALAINPAEAVQRTFVASFGNDANTATNCGFANPCRGFAAAQTVTDPRGEIVALDAAGYGAVTITKSIAITANPGFYAGISASSANGVNIATAGVDVVLRGLNINGLGGTGGNSGIWMTNGSSLSIENCVISNFPTGSGVFVSTAVKVRVVDSLFRDNGSGIYIQNGAKAFIAGVKVIGGAEGISIQGSPSGSTATASISDTVVSGTNFGIYAYASNASTVNVSVTRSTSSNNAYGIMAEGAGTTITVSNSMVTGNSAYGFYQAASGPPMFRSLGNNTVDQNGANSSGTITVISGL